MLLLLRLGLSIQSIRSRPLLTVGWLDETTAEAGQLPVRERPPEGSK